MSSLKSSIKKLKQAIKKGEQNPFLYKPNELWFMKRKLREIRDVEERYNKEQRNGFG